MKILLISLMLFSGIDENIININKDTDPVRIAPYIEYCEDTTNTGIDNITGDNIKWQRSDKKTLNFGFTDSVYWFRFAVENKSGYDLYLDIKNTTLNSIEFYMPSGREREYKVRYAGDQYVFNQREIKDKNFMFLIPASPGKQVYYLRIHTTYTFVLSPEILRVNSTVERDNRSIPGFWFYYGIMAALLLYNLFIFISLREKVYLSLMTIIGSWLLSQLAANGYGYMYLWPESPRIQHSAHAFATTMIGLGIGTFIQQVLESRKKFPVIHWLINVYMILFLFIAVAAVFSGERATRFTTFCMLYATPVSFISVTYAMAKGSRPAKFLFIAYSVDFVTKVITALSLHGVIDNYFLTIWGVKIGSAWFAVMLSLALADRINTFRLRLLESNRKLEISEETYRAIFNGTGEGIFIIDIDSEKIIDINQTGGALLGTTHEETINRTIEDFVVPDRLMLKNFPGMQKFSRSNAAPFEWELHRKDGSTFWAEISANPVIIRGEKRLMAVVRDISERRKFEDEKEQMQQQLIHAQKMESVGTLAGGIAHDFNNILAGILGSSSMLELYADKKQFDESNLKKYISLIKASSLRATDMIKQLLSFTRKDALKAVPVDLNDIIRHVVQICENSFPKSVTINASYCPGQAVVRGDPGSLEQVLLNLCVNASHAMTIMRGKNEHEGGVLEIGIVEITADRKFYVMHRDAVEGRAYFAVSVKDTGVGILDDKISKIFDPFFTTKEKQEGSGLGLSIVYNILKKHEGIIDVASTLHKGSTFTVYLPADKMEPAEEQEVSMEIKQGNGLVLVIDDEEAVRETACDMLMEAGYKTLQACDGPSGIDTYRKNADIINTVILDISMPGMSGNDVYRELISIRPDVKVIISSGYGLDDRVKKTMNLGAGNFLQKPYTYEKILQAMQEILKL